MLEAQHVRRGTDADMSSLISEPGQRHSEMPRQSSTVHVFLVFRSSKQVQNGIPTDQLACHWRMSNALGSQDMVPAPNLLGRSRDFVAGGESFLKVHSFVGLFEKAC